MHIKKLLISLASIAALSTTASANAAIFKYTLIDDGSALVDVTGSFLFNTTTATIYDAMVFESGNPLTISTGSTSIGLGDTDDVINNSVDFYFSNNAATVGFDFQGNLSANHLGATPAFNPINFSYAAFLGDFASITTGMGGTAAFAQGNASFSVAAVPEPETYAMFLAGLGLLGFARRAKQA